MAIPALTDGYAGAKMSLWTSRTLGRRRSRARLESLWPIGDDGDDGDDGDNGDDGVDESIKANSRIESEVRKYAYSRKPK
jgi:hypothetical protein